MDTPFNQMDIWAWMFTQERNDCTVLGYLKHLGFGKGTDTLTEDQYSILHGAVEHFHDTAPHMGSGVFEFSGLFTAHTDDTNGLGYWVSGMPGTYDPKPEVLTALHNAGWVCSISPHTTYFQVVNKNKIVAKYQTILGSRSLAYIKEL